MKWIGLLVALSALAAVGLLLLQRPREKDFSLDFLRDSKAEQIPSIPTRTSLLLKGTTAKSVVAQIGSRWTVDGWSSPKWSHSSKGEVCEWTNQSKGLVVRVYSGELARLNTRWLGRKAEEDDVLVDALTHVTRSTSFR